MIKLFVYGTLKRGYGNNYHLDNSTFLGEAETKPEYNLFNVGFPIAERKGTTSVKGEVWDVAEEDIDSIYRLEGYSGTPTKDGGDNWYDVDVINTPYGDAQIFVQEPGEGSKHGYPLPDGVWG